MRFLGSYLFLVFQFLILKKICIKETPIYKRDNKNGEMKKLLSRNCDGCSQLRACRVRYKSVEKGEKVYCPDGTAHLVDQEDVTLSFKMPVVVRVRVQKK